MRNRKVVVVHLRRPGAKDQRRDPFWEFGSFGLTQCHAGNLMNPKRIKELEGAKLAFAQGGEGSIRLLLLTPPVKVKKYSRKRCELLWAPHRMPIRFDRAPVIVRNDSQDPLTHFPKLKALVRNASRETWVERFSSCFRSRRRPLPQPAAQELIRKYRSYRRNLPRAAICRSYAEARPEPPQQVLTKAQRKKQHGSLLRAATRRCEPGRKSRGC